MASLEDDYKLNELGKVHSGGMQSNSYLVTFAAPSDVLVFIRSGGILYLRSICLNWTSKF